MLRSRGPAARHGWRLLVMAALVAVATVDAAGAGLALPVSPAQERPGGHPEPVQGQMGAEAEAGGATPAPDGGAGVLQAIDGLAYAVVEPCRVFDTRERSGPIGPQEFVHVGLTGICDVPFGPTKAVMASVISVNASSTGYVRAAAFRTGTSTATVLNFNAGLVSSNAVPLPVCDVATAPEPCSWDTWIAVPTGTTNLVIDILGYFYEPAAS